MKLFRSLISGSGEPLPFSPASKEMKEERMKFWHGFFILTFIIIYGTLALAVLGSSIYQTARSLVGRRPDKGRR